MKLLRWTAHAKKKATIREIAPLEVERTVADPDWVAPAQPPRRIHNRRYFDETLQMDVLLRVVIEETPTELVIVTAYKTSQLERYVREDRA